MDIMSWATKYINELKNGKPVEFRPSGGSMKGHIESGQLVRVVPINRELKINDIVLCKVNGSQYLHLVKNIKNEQYQIGNAKGFINGWISLKDIFGILDLVDK